MRESNVLITFPNELIGKNMLSFPMILGGAGLNVLAL